MILVLTVGFVFWGCSSKPEIPQEALKEHNKPKKLNRAPQMAKSSIRLLEQDCQMYSQPNFYSQHMSTEKGGNDVWTEETGTAWYRVYRKKQYGYISKICFKN